MNNKLKTCSKTLFLAALLVPPIIFFTNLTRNPYLIQERILHIFIAVSILLRIISSYRKKEIVLPRTFLDWPIWCFFTVALLSIAISIINYQEYRWAISGYAGRRMLMFLFCGIIPFYFAAGSDKKYSKKIQYAVIAAGTLASLYAIFQFLQLDFVWSKTVQPYGQRSISTFGNPNFFSAYVLIVVFWIIGHLFHKKQFNIWLSLLLLNLAGLAITMTRSSFMGLFVGVIILMYFFIYKLKGIFDQIKKPLYYVISGILLLIVLFSAVSPQFAVRIKSIVNIKSMGSALTQRLLIWESSYHMFKDTPVIGRGWGNFEIFYPFYQGRVVEKEAYRNLRTHANNSHNFFLELLTQVGMLGTGIYLWLMAVFIYFARNIYLKVDEKQKIWVLIFLVGGVSFWVDNILNVSLFFPIPAIAFWLNAGMLARLGRENYNFPELRIKVEKFYSLFVILAIAATAGVAYFNYKYFVSAMHFFKGFKYSRQGQLEKARDALLMCHKIYSLNVDSNYELGNIYARLKDKDNKNIDKSIWAYQQAIRANPGYDEIYFNLGIMYMKKNNIEKAQLNIEKAVNINPVSVEAIRTIGDIKGQLKKYKEAIFYYEKAIKLTPGDETLWNNCGYYYEVTGELNKALEYYRKALEVNPEFKSALLNINRARRAYSAAVPLEKISQLFGRIDKLIEKKDWQGALELTKKIIKIDPVNLKALLYAGNIYFKIGDINKAMKFYKTILVVDPNNSVARANLEIISKAKKQ